MTKYALLDGNYTIIRSVCASNSKKMTNGSVFTGGIVVFLNILHRIKDLGELIVVLDGGHSAYRKSIYPEYKYKPAKETESTPDELAFRAHMSTTFKYVETLLPLMGIPVLKIHEEEADDVIYRLADRIVKEGGEATVVSDDSDYVQMVNIGATVFRPMKEEIVVPNTPEEFKAQFYCYPQYFTLMKALTGDGSDNVSGVPGVGDATAIKIINAIKEPSVAAVKEWASSTKSAAAKKVLDNIHILERNIKLVDLSVCDLDEKLVATCFAQAAARATIDRKEVMKIFSDLALNSMGKWIVWLMNRENKIS